jgi:tRNA(fMet)-specific endonuclease VapC
VKYVLDTNAFSALMRGDPAMLARLQATDKIDVAVPQPVLAEIEYGLTRLPKSRRRDRLRARFELVRDEIARATWADEVSAQFGAIKAELERLGTRIEDFDVAIAAHALAYDAVLVTADRSHMSRVRGLSVEDWTAEPK